MDGKEKICDICSKPESSCECCDGCGHICALDYGELYCPVCFPEPGSDTK